MALREGYSISTENTPPSSSWTPFSTNSTNSHSPPSSASSVRSLRKRHSFFGRSTSDASRLRRIHAPHSSTLIEDPELGQAQPRPGTALSTNQPHRRKTDPLESIRNSIFGGRKTSVPSSSRERADSNASRPSSRNDQLASAVPSWSREHFRTKEDYDRYLTKQSISPPFNFEHVTHTAKTQLPALETVEEKDLPGEFWSVSAYQRPKRHLNGIKADDLTLKHQQMGIKRGSPSSRPTSPISRSVSPIATNDYGDRPVLPQTMDGIGSLDETMFDEVNETRFDPDNGVRTLEPARQTLRYPKRFSSLNALNDQAAHGLGHSATFYESNSSNASGEEEIRSQSPDNAESVPEPPIDLESVAKEAQETTEKDIAYRSKQPLPPLPAQKTSNDESRNSSKSKTGTTSSNLSVVIPIVHPTPRSKQPSQASPSARKSLTFSSLGDLRDSIALSDATWEDDVDFCYEQAAESTCNFNWTMVSQTREPSSQVEDSARPPISPYHAYSPVISNDSGSSIQLNGSSETIAERRRSRAAASAGLHKRGSSVGHRGFLAARKSSTDLNAMSIATPAPLQITPNSAPLSLLSPVFSATAADGEAQKSEFTPGTLHLPGINGINSDCLSDPESCRDSSSSKHRKSSSYGSRESTARPAANSTREANRWSLASTNSLPELMHSRPKSRVFLSKTIISAPLESLPQSPPMEPDVEKPDSTIVPREFQTKPIRNSFVMRPGDRAVLQAAGRVVQQRGSRPGTPSRFSRLVQPSDGAGVPGATGTGPAWI